MFHINDKITYIDKNSNQSIGKIMRVLRNNNVIIKKVMPDSNFITKIKSSSILYNNTKNINEKIDEKIYLQEYTENFKYKKTDEYDDAYSSNMLKNYHELIDRLDNTNTFCDVILPIFITVYAISSFIIILYISYIEILYK